MCYWTCQEEVCKEDKGGLDGLFRVGLVKWIFGVCSVGRSIRMRSEVKIRDEDTRDLVPS